MFENFNRNRRNKTMKYNKPEVVKLASAVNAIQGQEKSQSPADNVDSFIHSTVGAYESDE
jgi:hypothetical protein